MKESEDTQRILDELIEKRLATYMKEPILPTEQGIDKLSKKMMNLKRK